MHSCFFTFYACLTVPAIGFTADVVDMLNNVNITLVRMNAATVQMNATTGNLARNMELANQFNHNPYATMAQTTESVKFDVRVKIFLPYCGLGSTSSSVPTCMYSGITHRKVGCAHILPKSTQMSSLKKLCITQNEVNHPKNLVWLCPGIENAFDSMMLSFVPRIMPGLIKRYCMIIWDNSCLDMNLEVGDERTLADIYAEDKTMNFTIRRDDGSSFEHSFYKRMFANHALWCYYNKYGEFPQTMFEGGDFSSLNGEQRQRLVAKEYVCDSMSVIQKEIADEEKD